MYSFLLQAVCLNSLNETRQEQSQFLIDYFPFLISLKLQGHLFLGISPKHPNLEDIIMSEVN